MEMFAEYLKGINYYAIIDLVIMLLITALLVFFLIRRNNIRLALAIVSFLLVYVAVTIITALSPEHILYVTQRILTAIGFALIVSMCIVYSADIKTLVSKLSRWKDRKDLFHIVNSDDDLRQSATEIVKACQTLSKNDIGALIVIAPNSVPNHVLNTGTTLNAKVSSGLLQSIFNVKAPLHDGAIVIKGDIILGAGCFLPISQKEDISKDLGTRHRAAIGITEESDVLAIVVSEETGVISVVKSGVIRRYMTPERLQEEIEEAYHITYSNTKKKRGNK